MKCSITFGSTSSQGPAFCFLALLSKFYDSKTYRDNDMTRERINFTFDPRNMLLSCCYL